MVPLIKDNTGIIPAKAGSGKESKVCLNGRKGLSPKWAGLVLVGVLIQGCAVKNKDSMHLLGERVVVQPVKSGNDIAPFGVIAASVVPKIIDFTTIRLSEILEAESQKYTASYLGKYVGDDFYKSDGSTDLTYSLISVERYIRDPLPSDNRETLASSLTLGFRTNREGNLLTLQPVRVMVHRTKAKLKSGDHDVDLLLSITLNGYWQTKSGEIKSRELADISLVLQHIELGEQYLMKQDAQGLTYLENDKGSKSNFNVMSEWFAPVPYSINEKGAPLEKARGNFVISVLVTETDDYGSRVERYSRDVRNSRAIWTELAKKLLD